MLLISTFKSIVCCVQLHDKIFLLQDDSGEIKVDYSNAFIPSSTNLTEGMD